MQVYFPIKNNYLQFGCGTLLFQLLLSLLAQRFTQDLPGWILRDRVKKNYPAGDPLGRGDFPIHEVGNILWGSRVAWLQDHIRARSLVIVPSPFG